jgi:ABC-type multidrug transport system fused ATPase/permease subunit
MYMAQVCLEEGDFGRADILYDKVLDKYPEYVPAYEGKFKAEAGILHLSQLSEVENFPIPLTEFKSYRNLHRFADQEQRDYLDKCNQAIVEELARREETRKEEMEKQHLEEERIKQEQEHERLAQEAAWQEQAKRDRPKKIVGYIISGIAGIVLLILALIAFAIMGTLDHIGWIAAMLLFYIPFLIISFMLGLILPGLKLDYEDDDDNYPVIWMAFGYSVVVFFIVHNMDVFQGIFSAIVACLISVAIAFAVGNAAASVIVDGRKKKGGGKVE